MKYYCEYEVSEIHFLICQEGQSLTEMSTHRGVLSAEERQKLQAEGWECRETELLQRAKRELAEYFAGDRKQFDLPLEPRGTEFQKKVWQALREIPYGETATYGQIAKRVGSPGGARAVGMACNRNHIIIAIPCHRVIGASGKLVGFECGLDMKEKLLSIERNKEFTHNTIMT